MKIYIKNMVSQGTRFHVHMELERLGFKYYSFGSGEIDFKKELSSTELEELDFSLQKYGLDVTLRKDKVL